MHISVEQASGRAYCRHNRCSNDPTYIENGRIKKGTMCAAISTSSAGGGHTSFYCRNCIEIICEDVKKILDPKLWIFH